MSLLTKHKKSREEHHDDVVLNAKRKLAFRVAAQLQEQARQLDELAQELMDEREQINAEDPGRA